MSKNKLKYTTASGSEDFGLEFESDEDLSYFDLGLAYITLLHKDKFAAKLYVWLDAEMKDRQYILSLITPSLTLICLLSLK